MDKDVQIQVQIERYLDGLMAEAEIAAFEQQLQGDGTLRDALEEERMVRDAMQQLREQELRAKLKQWRQNAPEPPAIPETPTNMRFGWRFWIGILAVSLLMFWAYRFFMPGQPPKTPEKIKEIVADSNSQANKPLEKKEESQPQKPTPKSPTNPLLQHLASVQALIKSDLGLIKPQPIAKRTISSTVNPDSLSTETLAATALEMGEFDKALQYLAQLNASNSEVRYMKAHAFFGAKQYPKAAEEFRTLVNSSQYGPDARWNIVMCYFAQYPEGQEDYRREIEQILQGKSKKLQKKAKAWQEQVQRTMPSK